MMKSTIYKELHSKRDISSVCFCSDGDCDATQWAWTECPQQYNKKTFCLQETWDKKNTFSLLSTLYPSFHQLYATFCMWFTSPWVLHCHLDSLKFRFLEKFNSCTSLPTYAQSNRILFFDKVFCFVFHFSPMFRDCQSLIWRKSKQTKKKPQNNKTSQYQVIFAFWSLSFLHTREPWVFFGGFWFCFFFPSIP